MAPREVAGAILCALGRLQGRLRRVPGSSRGSPGGCRSDPVCSGASPGDPWRALGGPTSFGDPLSSALRASPSTPHTSGVRNPDNLDSPENPKCGMRTIWTVRKMWNPESGIWNPESGIRKPEARSRNSESRIQNLESGSRKPEARIQNPESRTPNREADSRNLESRVWTPES